MQVDAELLIDGREDDLVHQRADDLEGLGLGIACLQRVGKSLDLVAIELGQVGVDQRRVDRARSKLFLNWGFLGLQRHCQSKWNRSSKAQKKGLSGYKLAPLGQGSRAVLHEDVAAD